MKKLKSYIQNLIFPALIFGFITGVLTASVVILYKLLAKYVISFSESSYEFLRQRLYFVPIVLVALYFIAWLFAKIYKTSSQRKNNML